MDYNIAHTGTTVQFNFPENWKVKNIGNDIYLEAFIQAVELRISELRKEIILIELQISIFINRYNVSFKEFSQQLPDSFEAHEDWIDWSFQERLQSEKQSELANLAEIVSH